MTDQRPDPPADDAGAVTGERARRSSDDVGVVVSGLAFVGLASLPWYVARFGPGEQVAFRAWDLGLPAVLAVLLSVYAAGRVVWLRFRPLKPDVPLAPGVEPLAAAVVSLVLVLYRSLDMPDVPVTSAVEHTVWIIAALFAVTFQAVFAIRAVARTGIRA